MLKLGMPRGKQLSQIEREKIQVYHDCGLSNREIGEKMQRSHTVVGNYLNLGESYCSKRRPGPVPKISKRDKRNIISIASQKNVVSKDIIHELNLPVTPRRVQQILSTSDTLKWSKRKPKPALKSHHETKRLQFAQNCMSWTTEWDKIIFSDEKKFNLDGPDGNQYYWHDLRKEPQTCFSRNFGGGTVMVWAAFHRQNKSPICWISTKMTSADYVNFLENVLTQFGESVEDDNWVFQHDNASIHSARATKNWLQLNNIQVLDWPACSPDLNPIENLWGVLSRLVYAGGRQYNNINELKCGIREAWSQIDQRELGKLIDSMPKRIYEVILKQGGNTHY